MGFCQEHIHSSPERAEKCWAKRFQRRADRHMRNAQPAGQFRDLRGVTKAGKITPVLYFHGREPVFSLVTGGYG